MRTLPIFVAVIAAAVTSVLAKEAAKHGKVELGLHAIVRRSPPGRRSRERSRGSGYGYGCLTCGGGYHYGHGTGGYSHGGLSYGRGRHSGGRSRGPHHSGGRSRWGRGRHGGGRSYRGRIRGGRSRGGRSRGGRSRATHGGSFERYGYHHGGYEPSCICPFLTSGSERRGSGGVGHFDSVEINSSQNPGYYRQWYQAFSNHPCCAGSHGVITNYQRTRSRGYGVQ